MNNDLKEKAMLQVEKYEKEHGISLLEDIGKSVRQTAEECNIYAPHYFTNDYVERISPKIIETYKELLKTEKIFESSKNDILESSFAEKFKKSATGKTEKLLCEGFAEIFFEKWGKGNFQKGMEKFLQAMFCNKKNYEYFYINSKEFASLANSINSKYAEDFKKSRNHWFNGYLKFQNVYLIIAMFPIALPYLLLKKITKRLAGIPNSREKILKDPYLTEMFVILEKAGYWK
jgi:hypothetical protein